VFLKLKPNEVVALIALLKSHHQEIRRGILLTGNILQILAFVGVAETGKLPDLPRAQVLSGMFERHVNCSAVLEMPETRFSQRVPLTTQAR
jgi:hypothetical protein